MSATATAPKRTSAQILRDLKALPFSKLDKLVPKIIELRMQKHPYVRSPREEWLRQHIEAGVPQELRSTYAKLIEKRRDSGLNAAEQRRLLAVVERMENFNVTWLEWAVELATVRQVFLPQLLKSLDISRPSDVCV